jgi:DNA primase
MTVRRPRDAPREIAILAILIGHPRLLEGNWEEVAGLEFASRALTAFRTQLLAFAPDSYATPEALAAALAEAGAAGERARILAAAAKMPIWWCLRAEADSAAAEHVLRQTLALQRKSGALHKEVKMAEAALAAEPTEQNFARLLDIKSGLADLADVEAAIEGFGEFLGSNPPPV